MKIFLDNTIRILYIVIQQTREVNQPEIKMIKTGDRILAKKMADDSFYLQAEGIVTEIRNGFVKFQADYVKDRYSKEWKKHPSSCATSTRVENAAKIYTPEQSVKFQIA